MDPQASQATRNFTVRLHRDRHAATMETTEELQQLEITALKSIYDQEFFEPPPPRVWRVCRCCVSIGRVLIVPQGAARLPEFIIKVVHPDPLHAPKVYFHLHTR